MYKSECVTSGTNQHPFQTLPYLTAKFPGRQTQISKLYKWLCFGKDPNHIFIHSFNNSGAGKTTILRSCLDTWNLNYAYVSSTVLTAGSGTDRKASRAVLCSILYQLHKARQRQQQQQKLQQLLDASSEKKIKKGGALLRREETEGGGLNSYNGCQPFIPYHSGTLDLSSKCVQVASSLLSGSILSDKFGPPSLLPYGGTVQHGEFGFKNGETLRSMTDGPGKDKNACTIIPAPVLLPVSIPDPTSGAGGERAFNVSSLGDFAEQLTALCPPGLSTVAALIVIDDAHLAARSPLLTQLVDVIGSTRASVRLVLVSRPGWTHFADAAGLGAGLPPMLSLGFPAYSRDQMRAVLESKGFPDHVPRYLRRSPAAAAAAAATASPSVAPPPSESSLLLQQPHVDTATSMSASTIASKTQTAGDTRLPPPGWRPSALLYRYFLDTELMDVALTLTQHVDDLLVLACRLWPCYCRPLIDGRVPWTDPPAQQHGRLHSCFKACDAVLRVLRAFEVGSRVLPPVPLADGSVLWPEWYTSAHVERMLLDPVASDGSNSALMPPPAWNDASPSLPSSSLPLPLSTAAAAAARRRGDDGEAQSGDARTMPKIMQLVLIAAYIASRNKPVLDKSLFDMAAGGAGRRRGRRGGNVMSANQQAEAVREARLRGPHPFAEPRMAAIFRSLWASLVAEQDLAPPQAPPPPPQEVAKRGRRAGGGSGGHPTKECDQGHRRHHKSVGQDESRRRNEGRRELGGGKRKRRRDEVAEDGSLFEEEGGASDAVEAEVERDDGEKTKDGNACGEDDDDGNEQGGEEEVAEEEEEEEEDFDDLDVRVDAFRADIMANDGPLRNAVATLLSFGLLAQAGGGDPLEPPRLRCCIADEAATQMAAACGLRLSNYLLYTDG